ncbi:DinB family protein [Granulicella arctica]|uniref:DinB family protein n=1 Tax=Granulicella arctica TaxID=940613 RepID=UPI0021E0F722|nr:DinB family protein [Granulicella arctica]
MSTKYADETALAELDPVALGMRLSEVVGAAMPWLEQVSGKRAGEAPSEGKWCAKEVIGHLIDSAVNNLQRIVRLDTVLDVEPEVRSLNYEQDEWVRAQHYAEKEWVQILELWRVLNAHIAWTMGHVARGHLGRICVFPDGHVTLCFLMEDYVAHMDYHLKALRELV